MNEQSVHVTLPKPTYEGRKSRIEIANVEVLTDGVSTCSSAFIQFSDACPRWAAKEIAKYMDAGYFTLKTAKIGEQK